MLAALSRGMGRGSQVYLGNSLPIREWDLGATSEFRDYEIWGSRGVNGIDGQVSTFFGFSKENQENWAVLGDLTALYDLAGPFIVSPSVQRGRTLKASLVVVNNGGGKIFSKVFPESEFQNNHQVHFEGWAKLWNLSYECWSQIPEKQEWSGTRIVELIPDEQASERFWKSFEFLLDEQEAVCG
jgi:2-succinyl-5-enolpyruvyl-6-hydroxy-3-cyclohexene-1-carboxylate synthase